MVTGLSSAALIAGCEGGARSGILPRPIWDPVADGQVGKRQPTVVKPPVVTRTGSGAPGDPIPRSVWTRSRLGSNINRMNGVNRITIHHEGMKTAVLFSDYERTKQRMELIRSSHTKHRRWADIGYHFVVDRAGRVWEGRPIRYQGAHVRDNNEHNVGLMLLGNFNLQRPTDAQLESMGAMVRYLRATYRVSLRRVYTHKEIRPTSCPGRYLQAKVGSMRSNGVFS